MTNLNTNTEQERWTRVKGRLKAEVGDDIFSSWFARMDLEAVEKDTARLSVPTRFLKSWIQSHYSDRVLRCWQAEEHDVQRIDIMVRTAAIKSRAAPSRASMKRPNRCASRGSRRRSASKQSSRLRQRCRCLLRMKHRAARRSIRG